jgi:DnaJ-class molecular chaperone
MSEPICGDCNGTGRRAELPCETCGATGAIAADQPHFSLPPSDAIDRMLFRRHRRAERGVTMALEVVDDLDETDARTMVGAF